MFIIYMITWLVLGNMVKDINYPLNVRFSK